ncbi:hypothetical protein [Sphingomonas sp. H160509]|uniref:hypothetical protein n=1 Tax=Sphingomonas sp. H160509 TaxID=2955313 RepID=UPI00406C7255
MTPIWHDGPLDALVWDGQSPVAWSVAETGPYAAGLQGDARAIRRGLASALIRKLVDDSVDVRLTRSPAGAPIVSAPGGWYLSLSSRGAHALIGVARAPIAVDREVIDDHAPLWDMLTPIEVDALRRLPAPRSVPSLAATLDDQGSAREAHRRTASYPPRVDRNRRDRSNPRDRDVRRHFALLEPFHRRRDRNHRAVEPAMTRILTRRYEEKDRAAVLAIFDSNLPRVFRRGRPRMAGGNA